MPRAFAATNAAAPALSRQQGHACISGARHRHVQALHKACKVTLAASCAAALLAATPADAISGGKESVGIFTPLDDQDWTGRDLRKVSFVKASMRRTKFDNSDLSGTSMFGSLAEGASFKGATMRGTSIESADMDSVDFTDAILEGAQIAGTQFRNNKLDNSDWTDVLPRKDQKAILCAVAKGTNPTTGVDTRESLGCK